MKPMIASVPSRPRPTPTRAPEQRDVVLRAPRTSLYAWPSSWHCDPPRLPLQHPKSTMSSMLQFPRKLLFGDDKLAFLSSPTGIPRLWRERNIPTPPEDNAHVYWASFTTVFDTPSDVFSLLSVPDIRRALEIAPENVASLVRLVAAHLESLIEDPAFCPQPPSRARQGLLSGWIPVIGTAAADANAPKDGRDRTREALNCVRILTRLLPVIMEGSTAGSGSQPQHSGTAPLPYDPRFFSAFEYDLLWKQTASGPSQPSSGTEKPVLASADSDNQFVIDDGADDDDESGEAALSDPLNQPSEPAQSTAKTPGPPSTSPGADTKTESEPCFMEQLLEVCINLLFRSGFTVPWTTDDSPSAEASFVHLIIWYAGVGSSQPLEGTTRAHESHRVEVLRLFLVVLSKSMYIPVAEQRSVSNAVASYAVGRLDRTVVLPLLCSLLNAVSTHTRDAGWLGMGMGGLGNNRLLGGAEDTKATLTALSLQSLNVLIGHEHARGSIPPTPGTPGSAPIRPGLPPFHSTQSVTTSESTAPNGTNWPTQKNAFRFYLSKLHRSQDFHAIWTSLSAILNAPMSASAAFLPLVGPGALGSGLTNAAAGVHVPEAMMLLWRLSLHNAKFRAFLLDDEEQGKRSLSLLQFILFHALSGKDQVPRHGLVRLCAFMLQDLSAEKAFGLHISKPGSGALAKLPAKFGIVGTNAGNGSGADVLIQSIYSLIATTKGSLSSLYPPLVIALTNTAPYWRNMTVTSATRLGQLLRSFSAPAYLLADEGNPRNLYYLLEALSLVLQYHFANNANFAYALVRSGPTVEKLATFTLRRGIADIRRRRARAGVVVQPPPPPAAPAAAATAIGPGSRQGDGNDGSTPGSRIVSGGVDTPAGILSPGVGQEQQPPSLALSGTESGADNEKVRLAQREAELEAAAQQALSLNDANPNANGDAAAPTAGTTTMSEKARGKLRQSSISLPAGADASADGLNNSIDSTTGTLTGTCASLGENGEASGRRADEEEVDELVFSLTEEELYEAARTVGRHGFVPTQEWVTSWQKGLPLDTIQLALTELKPKVEALCASEEVLNRPDADERVLAFLREQTLAGVLPPAPPIATRPFRWTDQSQVWLMSYLWGCIYASAVLPHAIWRDTDVRLFQVLEPPSASSSASPARA